MARRILFYLPAIGYGIATGPVDGVEDAVVLLQGNWESLPLLTHKVEQALKKVDPAEVFGAIGSTFAKMTSPQALQQQWTLGAPQQPVQQQWSLGAAQQPVQQQWAMAAPQQPMQQRWALGGGSYGYAQPMFQQLRPAAYGGQPMFRQLAPAAYGQPMMYQQRPLAGAAAMQPNFMLTPLAQQAAQMQQAAEAAKDAAETAMLEGLARVKATSKRRQRDLAFVHVPGNYGHTIERAALMSQEADGLDLKSAFEEEEDTTKQQLHINMALGPSGEAWGMMAPDLRQLSETTLTDYEPPRGPAIRCAAPPRTGCEVYSSPPKYWPEAALQRYFRYDQSQNKTVFGMLRDPYDKLVNEFRLQVLGVSALSPRESRKAISEREGNLEREGPEYQSFYDECDVNSWVKAELTKVKNGDRFRGNCHLLPQAEFFEGPHGIQVPIDNRLVPQTFDEVMGNHGYDIRLSLSSHSLKCDVSAWSLDDEAKELIREVYADDFQLVCKHFGYCDDQELTCLKQIPRMCGGSPNAD